MPLTLTITSYQNRSSTGNTTTIVEHGSITIGRAPDNDWVLPDPEMVLSRKHCRVSYQNGYYFLTDTSVNGVFINQSEQGSLGFLQYQDALLMLRNLHNSWTQDI